jgi:hypothetical protein
VFNILDYSAVSFPSGIYANKQLDKAESGTKPLSEVDAQIQAECEWILNSITLKTLTLNQITQRRFTECQ